MAEERVERKLAAILVVDVVGPGFWAKARQGRARKALNLSRNGRNEPWLVFGISLMM